MSNALSQIEHIVVLMLENRSFDNVLGWLYDAQNPAPNNQTFDGLTPLPPPNPWTLGSPVAPGHGSDPTQPHPDPNEIYEHVYMQMFNPSKQPKSIPCPAGEPNMLGFLNDYTNAPNVVPTLAPIIMNCFRPADVPVISQLAYWYAVCDHWYSSAPTQTYANRSFVHAGTSSGYVDNLLGSSFDVLNTWKNDTATIFNLMEDNGKSWRIYFGGSPLLCNAMSCQKQLAGYGPSTSRKRRTLPQRIFPMAQFQLDLQNYKSDPQANPFPSYVFIEPNFLGSSKYGPENDEHPQPIKTIVDGLSSVSNGERLIAEVFNALSGSDLWTSTLFVVVFDEHGGTYDHQVPLTPAIAPDDVVIAPGQKGYSGFDFKRYGVRVPAVVMSPWIKKGTVSNVVYDHTSIIRTVCNAFLPAGTHLLARDAAANDLSSLLTCTTPRTDLPSLPKPPAPAFSAEMIADMPLTDFQKDLLLSGLAMAASDDSGAQIPTAPQTHADAWRILEMFD